MGSSIYHTLTIFTNGIINNTIENFKNQIFNNCVITQKSVKHS